MRKLVVLFLGILVLSLPAMANERPKVEIFGGYSYLRADDDSDGLSLHGWNAAIQGNVNNWFSIVGDISGHYRSDEFSPGLTDKIRIYTFLVGPQISKRTDKATFFIRVLAGGSHLSVSSTGLPGDSENAFAVAFGGGADVNVSKRIAIRLFQADYVLTRFASDTQHNFRLSTGLVLRLGNE